MAPAELRRGIDAVGIAFYFIYLFPLCYSVHSLVILLHRIKDRMFRC